MRRISARMVLAFLHEPFMVWCDLFAPKEEKEEFSAFTKQLMQQGIDFQTSYTATLGSAVSLPFIPDDLDAGFEKTKELLKQGTALIANMPLVDKQHNLQGIADVLVKKSTHKSVFGKFHYIVHEVKSGKELKEEYCLQAAFYHLILGRIQGYTPVHFFVVTNGDDGPVAHKVAFEDYEYPLKQTLIGIQRMMDLEFTPAPNLKNCDEPWLGFCKKKAMEQDDISLVANVGTDKQLYLRNAGITTVKRLMEVTGPIKGIADTKLEQLKQCAKAFKTQQSFLLQEPRLPSGTTELFIDFEGIELDGRKTEYLLGIGERTGKKESFHVFVAHTSKEEGKMIKDAFAFMATHKDAPIFHYGSYEKTAIKALAARYRLDAKPFLERMTDILQACKRCVAPASSTFQLKDFGKVLGASWRGGMNAPESMVLYGEYQRTKDRKILQRLIDYNEDDVKATMIVKDWLARSA